MNIEKLKKQILNNIDQQKISLQKSSGKNTAQERINLILDENSFQEVDQFANSPILATKNYGDGVITGFGKINGRKVVIYSQDFTIRGGSVGTQHAKKICKIMDMAAKVGCPIIGVIDSGGARIDEGIHGLAGYGEIFLRNTRYSGIVPQISVILGPCAGGAVYSPALTDFILTTKNISHLFVTGPNVIKKALHQDITKEELGGALVHNQKSGVAHLISENENDCLEKLKVLLSYLPSNYLNEQQVENETFQQEEINLETIIPENFNKSYDIKNVIKTIFDDDSFFEIQELFAQNIVIGFAKLNNLVVGIVANQPLVKAGCIDIDASCKVSRFVNFCNSFSVPIVTLVDVPGFLPGVEQEHNGIIRHGAKLLYAYSNATTPKITVILRKAYGGAYIAMASKHLGADFNFALPNSQIAVMDAKGATSILHRKKIKEIKNENEKEKYIKEIENKYKKDFLNPLVAAEHGYIDSIIEPNQTRNELIKALEFSLDKVEKLPHKKSSNIPL